MLTDRKVSPAGAFLLLSPFGRLLGAYEEHQALLKEQESLKRKAENG